MAIVVSKLTAGANVHLTTAEEANGMYTDFVSPGVIGATTNTSGVAPATGSFAVNATGTPDANIQISAGVAYVTGTPTSQNSQTFRVKNSATTSLAISANSSGSTKYDWIYIKLDATKLNTPNTAGDDVATIVASRSSSASSDDGTPPTYGKVIAVVTVANGFSTITNGNIRDARVGATISATAANTSQDWYSTGAVPSTVTYNGNRNYDLTITSTDLTSFLSAGMKLKLSRTVTAPTQCTDLESTSSQYYSKTSPSAMTFTDDFVVSAWVKLESYGGASGLNVASRFNGTSGWNLKIGALGSADGRVQLTGFNAGSGNFSTVASTQSVPLNKWVHITAQLDMSAFTATSTTSYVMIDGVDVPSAVARGGTNPTALVQAGDLNIGAANSTDFFDGKIAQVAIFNAKVTQATMRTYISQGLSGSETSLISAYSFNGVITDLSANANNLTANGSAVATSADSPFAGQASGTVNGVTEYAEIVSATYSSNTTLVVRVPEGNSIPTSGGVSALSYSSQVTPYGFPGISNVLAQILIHTSNATATTIVQALGFSLTYYQPVNRNVRISVVLGSVQASSVGSPSASIWDGVVSSGTQLSEAKAYVGTGTGAVNLTHFVDKRLTSGSHTLNLGLATTAGTATIIGSATAPNIFTVELI